MISHCPTHGTPLETSPQTVLALSDVSDWLQELPSPPPHPIAKSDVLVRLSTYLTSRINGSAGNAFIDTIPLHGLIELFALLAHFHHVAEGAPVSLSVRRKMYEPSNMSVGFEIALRGRDGICDFLTGYVGTVIDRVRNWNDVYSAVLHWLRPKSDNPEFAPLMELFQAHAISNLPLGPGDVFLLPVQERKVHTIATAAAEYELTKERVQKVIDQRWSEIGS
jgi:hypothetical protein